MQKRICWKKGMRLTDDILRASDEALSARLGNAMALAAAGRFGLFPCSRPFQLSLNITGSAIVVEALDCLAVTKDGSVIDVKIDTRYNNYLENSVDMPDNQGMSEAFLTISMPSEPWEETLDGFEEPRYRFDLVGVNSPIPGNALPIAHIVDTEFGGWHVDEIDFVPPCLFVTSHYLYQELLGQFIQNLKTAESKALQLVRTDDSIAFRVFWPMLQQILIDVEKGRDLLTPMNFLANVQKFVAAFTAACELDKDLNLEDADVFRNYALTPYNYKDVYQKIKEGLAFCFTINEKMDKLEVQEPKKPKPTSQLATPYIANDQLVQNCIKKTILIPVVNPVAGATVFYSTDGSHPSRKLPANGKISIDNSFNNKKVTEPDQSLTVKLKATINGTDSEVGSFTVTLHKDFTRWIGIEI